MKFACPQCQTVYRIPDARLKSRALQTVCKKCGATLRIPKRGAENTAAPQSRPEDKPRRLRRGPQLPPVMSMSSRTAASRDYLAIGVVVVAVLILIAAAVWVIRDIHRFFSGSGAVLTRMIQDMTAPETPNRENRAPTASNPQALKRLKEGHRRFRVKNYQDALKQYQAAVDLDPKNADAYFWRGRARLKTGRYDRAAEDFNRVLVLSPDHRRACDNLGWIYMKQQDYVKSLNFLNISLQLKPDNAWAYYTRGHVFYKAGQAQKALADARKACLLGYKPACRFYEEHK